MTGVFLECAREHLFRITALTQCHLSIWEADLHKLSEGREYLIFVGCLVTRSSLELCGHTMATRFTKTGASPIPPTSPLSLVGGGDSEAFRVQGKGCEIVDI